MDVKCGPLAYGGVGANMTVVFGDDGISSGQTQPAPSLFGSEIRIEDLRENFCWDAATVVSNEDPDIVGLVNASWAKMATPKSDLPWNSTTRAARLHACAGDVDRLLDQFDSHLSPLRTGMVSTDFRLRAVRTGDGDRRLAGELRSVQALAAAQPAIPASPCPMRGAFEIRDNTSRTTSHAGTARLR